MLHPHDTPAAQSAQPWHAPEVGMPDEWRAEFVEKVNHALADQSCGTCMSFKDRTCTDPQSIFVNETRHPGACCPLWARGSG